LRLVGRNQAQKHVTPMKVTDRPCFKMRRKQIFDGASGTHNIVVPGKHFPVLPPSHKIVLGPYVAVFDKQQVLIWAEGPLPLGLDMKFKRRRVISGEVGRIGRNGKAVLLDQFCQSQHKVRPAVIVRAELGQF
jgi:hypothetical protein